MQKINIKVQKIRNKGLPGHEGGFQKYLKIKPITITIQIQKAQEGRSDHEGG